MIEFSITEYKTDDEWAERTHGGMADVKECAWRPDVAAGHI